MERTQAEAFEQYIRDLRVVRSISRPSFPEGKAPAAVLEEIQTNALRCNTLMRQNEALLAQFVYDRDPASLTEEDIQGLSAFAGRLFNYANSEDMGVAFKVHQLLLAAARSREDVVKILLESAGSVAQDDYSAEAINRKLVLAAYLSVYAERLDEAGAQRYRATVEQVRRSADQYLEQMPASQYPRVVNSAAWELSKINTSSDETANRRMLGSILAGHKPTYVHSLMVAELTRALLQRQIETRPETLVGLLGCRSAAEVQARREELCQTAYECGLYHDLGKCAVLMYIDNNARRLLDEEFFCIQSHPRTGADILNRMGCGRTLALAALYHHCYYNGKGGYPNDVPSCPPEIKGIVDALSVADSLDAATDNIGRCYNLAKPFRTLLEELRAQSGTRYAPNVVALFEDERFCQQLAENTDAERKRVYLQVYHAGSEEK
ncbi:hypothetical protein CGS57_12225 [Faecalibacterium prausnitzii]|nr:hypothetical protein CGS53_12330 [Faecalibacterium prausnitzii]PDX77865.1 hypothetical protein CGS57_12225 [Faecalibacterium prausnitzii]